MNELEKAIFDELKASESFQVFFDKVSILQLSFNKTELKSLSKVVKYDTFVDKYGFQTLCYITDNIHKEKALFDKVPENVRIRELLSEYEKAEE